MESRQHGSLTLETNDEGLWQTISGPDGEVLCEMDLGLRLAEIPPCLHACMREAYEWAKEDNQERRAEMAKEAAAMWREEKAEWEWWYNMTRGV